MPTPHVGAARAPESVSASDTPVRGHGQLRKDEPVKRARQKAGPGHDQQEQRRPLARHHSGGAASPGGTAAVAVTAGIVRDATLVETVTIGRPADTGTSGAMALTRGEGDATTRRADAVIGAAAAFAIVAAAGLSQLLAGPSPGGSAAGRRAPALGSHPRRPLNLAPGRAGQPLLGVATPRTERPPPTPPSTHRRVHPAGAGWTLAQGQVGLSLVAAGRAGRLTAATPPSCTTRANRVAYAHGRHLSEWYANGPLGLEQGLRLRARPAARTAGALTFVYELSGPHIALLTGNRLILRTLAGAPLLSTAG